MLFSATVTFFIIPKSLTREQRQIAEISTHVYPRVLCLRVTLKINDHRYRNNPTGRNEPSAARPFPSSSAKRSLKIVYNRKLLSDRRIFIVTTFDPPPQAKLISPRLSRSFSRNKSGIFIASRAKCYFANSNKSNNWHNSK